MLYKTLVRPLLFKFNPESVHDLILRLGKSSANTPLVFLSELYAFPAIDRLKQNIFGYDFINPLGLAAGFDKNIQLIRLIRSIGFGFEEAGSVSAFPCEGNPKPRLFRLPEDKAIINCMGLNNKGINALISKIQYLPRDWPVGISLVKTHNPEIYGEQALDDFAESMRAIYGYGAYVSINISCPNTREGKTFEEPEILDSLLARLREIELECSSLNLALTTRPLCLKISPDLPPSQLKDIFDVACRHNITGWIACNTTSGRQGLKSPASDVLKAGKGGLSGLPLRSISTRIVGELYQLGRDQPDQVIMGVGGISDSESAWEKIIHGASLLQLYTGLIYEGPGLLSSILTGLCQKLDEHGFNNIKEAVGSAFRLK